MHPSARRRIVLKAIAASPIAAIHGTSKAADKDAKSTKSCPKPTKANSPMVKLQTNHGTITLELHKDKAPETVANFLTYVKSGHYDNTIFHRVIDGFMIQGGGFEPGMKEKSTNPPVKNEAGNGLTNDKYTVAMARTPNPHSATAQFFINVADNGFLNFREPTPQGFGYCVFGKVVEGSDVVDKIKNVETGDKGMHQNVPLKDVVIEKAEVC